MHSLYHMGLSDFLTQIHSGLIGISPGSDKFLMRTFRNRALTLEAENMRLPETP